MADLPGKPISAAESAAGGYHTSPSSTVASGSTTSSATHTKRTRILYSCGPCRVSKLKCDRSQPCGQCLKKARPGDCTYSPKVEKERPNKSMAARLKRLEGMVRTMINEDGSRASPMPGPGAVGDDEGTPATTGQVVHGENSTTYVGATHFMAILEDIEDLKSYFDEPDDAEADSPEHAEDVETPALILSVPCAPHTREEILNLLPTRDVADRLIMRYFASNGPSQQIIHRPTFVKEYTAFWQDQQKVSLHWLALLFMVLGMGMFYQMHTAPHETLEDGAQLSPTERFKIFKSAASWCLVTGKLSQPTLQTLCAFVIYVESDFIVARSSQMTCYLLSSVGIRLMLKMGLHRDPSKLANISPFEGEMRRRIWNMASQVDLLVSFHMGLPSMMYGLESDCELPRNLKDDDFDENTTELPPPRPLSDQTALSYPIFKSSIMRVFGQIARQAHALTPPPYSEVMRMDSLLEKTWASVPQFLKVRPLEECITDSAMQIVQRFGIASLYHKSKCVLHRRYLMEAIPKREHDYSRRECLVNATTMMEYQTIIWKACQPGQMLSQNKWFVSSLAVHDFLLAAMVVYMVAQNEHFSQVDGEYPWVAPQITLPSRDELLQILQRSRDVWVAAASEEPEVKKTAAILETVLNKVSPSNTPPPRSSSQEQAVPGPQQHQRQKPQYENSGATAGPTSDFDTLSLSGLSTNDRTSLPEKTADMSNMTGYAQSFNPAGEGMFANGGDSGWLSTADQMDWRYFDNMVFQQDDNLANLEVGEMWFDQSPSPNEFEFLASGSWDQNMAPRA